MQGWIKLHRQLLYSDTFKNDKLLKVWIYCLLKATHAECDCVVGRQTVKIKPGQFVFGRKKASTELDMPESTIRDYVELLVKSKNIDIKSTNKYSLITVIKWGDFQEKNETSDSKSDSKRTADGQQMDTYKNVKNVENEKEYLNTFEHVWFLYPRKKGKGSVSDTQKKKIHKIGIDEMTRCVERYRKATTGTKEQFLQYGSTFFNSGYIDYLDENFNQKNSNKETRVGVMESDSDLGPREEVWM